MEIWFSIGLFVIAVGFYFGRKEVKSRFEQIMTRAAETERVAIYSRDELSKLRTKLNDWINDFSRGKKRNEAIEYEMDLIRQQYLKLENNNEEVHDLLRINAINSMRITELESELKFIKMNTPLRRF